MIQEALRVLYPKPSDEVLQAEEESLCERRGKEMRSDELVACMDKLVAAHTTSLALQSNKKDDSKLNGDESSFAVGKG